MTAQDEGLLHANLVDEARGKIRQDIRLFHGHTNYLKRQSRLVVLSVKRKIQRKAFSH